MGGGEGQGSSIGATDRQPCDVKFSRESSRWDRLRYDTLRYIASLRVASRHVAIRYASPRNATHDTGSTTGNSDHVGTQGPAWSVCACGGN